MDNTKIVGANPEHGRRANDYYPTPPEVTLALLKFLKIKQGATLWEPACGTGLMMNVMATSGYNVIGTDILSGMDFLTCDPVKCDWIITNPPFSHAEQFIRRAEELNVPFAFLLKSQYWHAARRTKLFQEITPTYVLPLTWRPDFTGQGASLMDMCWCVWGNEVAKTCSYLPLEKPDINFAEHGGKQIAWNKFDGTKEG